MQVFIIIYNYFTLEVIIDGGGKVSSYQEVLPFTFSDTQFITT
jgi:hypothetical protein